MESSLSLGSPAGEAGAPCVQYLVEGSVERDYEGALEERASTRAPGMVTKIVANSFRMAEKWRPRSPRWLRARGSSGEWWRHGWDLYVEHQL